MLTLGADLVSDFMTIDQERQDISSRHHGRIPLVPKMASKDGAAACRQKRGYEREEIRSTVI